MGASVSKQEVVDGTAVAGCWDAKVEMPPGVYAEQMEGGMHPGSKMVEFTPTKVGELLDKCGARALYDKFEAEISADCGGQHFTGWDSKKIYEKVNKYQDEFKAKGIEVTYNMVTWQYWVSHGPPHHGGHVQIEYRYWMTYADVSIAPGFKPQNSFDPDKDYANPGEETKPEGVIVLMP